MIQEATDIRSQMLIQDYEDQFVSTLAAPDEGDELFITEYGIARLELDCVMRMYGRLN